MRDKFKVLIAGGGDMGATHLAGYAALKEVRVAAIADPDLPRAVALADTHHVENTYADYQQAIEQEKPDIVSVCAPACLHAEMAIYAMQQGRHVLCEKPIALTLDDGAQMANISESMQGRLGIVFQRRYLHVWQEVERRLPRLGEPLSYQATDFRQVRPKRLMHSRSGNGGPVIDCCVHEFDMALRLFGPAQHVYATGNTLAAGKAELRDIQDLAVDTAAISLQFDKGHTALISYCWGLPAGVHDLSRTEIIGPEGMLRVGDSWVEHHMAGGRVETVTGLNANGHAAQIADFVRALRNHEPLPVAPREALQALRIAHAALESAATGNVQHLEQHG